MSRTYKDQPDWVKANKTGHKKIRHHYRCEDNEGWQFTSTRKEKIITEPHWHLEEFTHYNNYGLIRKNGLQWVYSSTEEEIEVNYIVGRDKPCDLDLEHNTGKRCSFYYAPPDGTRWWHNETDKPACQAYYASERHHSKASLKNAKDEYNSYGETDEEPYDRHNPSGLYGGGYYW